MNNKKNEMLVADACPINFIKGDDGVIDYSLKIASVPVSEMAVDSFYQRVAGSNVKYLTKNWDSKKCDPLYVSYRNDKFYIMNGQHRYLAARERGITYLPCIIRTGLTQKQEAKVFVQQGMGTKKLSVYDTYKGNLLYGEEIDTKIEKVVNDYGLKIIDTNSRSLSRQKIGGITELRTIVKNFGDSCLRWIFDIIKECGWCQESNGYDVAVVRMLKNTYSDYYKTDKLDEVKNIIINFLKRTNPTKFKTHAMVEYQGLKERRAMITYLKDSVASMLNC